MSSVFLLLTGWDETVLDPFHRPWWKRSYNNVQTSKDDAVWIRQTAFLSAMYGSLYLMRSVLACCANDACPGKLLQVDMKPNVGFSGTLSLPVAHRTKKRPARHIWIKMLLLMTSELPFKSHFLSPFLPALQPFAVSYALWAPT